MGAWDFLEEAGPSSKEKFANGSTQMEIDDDLDLDYSDSDDELGSAMQGLDEGYLKMFCRKAATSFFEKYGLISHQINSYNDFVKHGIQQVFDSVGEITVEPSFDPSKKGDGDWRYASLKFGKVTLEHPTFFAGEKFSSVDGFQEHLKLSPRYARLQNMTYSSRIKVETHLQVYTKGLSRSDKFKTGVENFVDKTVLNDYHSDVIFGRLPVMVKSDLCWMHSSEKRDCEFDQGGYFVIKGAEKTFIAQEQMCLSRLWVTKTPTWTVAYRPVSKRKRVYIKEVVNLIDLDIEDSAIANILIASIYDADKKYEGFRKEGNAVKHIEDLMKSVKSPPKESVEECIKNYLFPNLSSPRQKACLLAYMVKCLLEAYRGRRKVDNRDDLRNKRLELARELLERELKIHIKHAERLMVKSIQRDLDRDRELQPIEHYLDASIITNGLSRAFSTGAWSHPYKKMERVSGVVATIRRTNPLQATADMRKTRQQVSYTGRVGDARYPHPSHWGKICFLSTPDGENCGLVKNLASMGLVSTSILQQESLLQRFRECGMEKLDDDMSSLLDGKHKIFLDGDWVGICKDSSSFVSKLRRKRSQDGSALSGYLGLNFLLIALRMHTCTCTQWVIEFIGPEEEEDCQTAWGIKHLFTAELDNPPSSLPVRKALSASHWVLNHKSEHQNRHKLPSAILSPEATFSDYSSRLPREIKIIRSPKWMLPRPEFFNGQCAIVAVNVHLGYNQEDSLVMNRASLERGMFRTEHVRSYKAEVENPEAPGKKQKIDDLVSFGKTQSKIGRVDSLEDDGFPYVGANLQTGDIVIGKHAASGVDHSIKLKHTERGMVQKVVLSSNDEGKNFAVVSLRQVRSPCLGDKFSSMHGQKGVLGFLESQENFPFTKQGIVPDIVINPHAFPSRQTPGQLLEAALGKGIALGGALKYATPFSTPSVEDITAQLHRLGFSRWGDERVYDGRTGEKVHSLIFMGPTFYQRLTHMSEDKVKFRNTGPVHPLTRQPVADRKRFGGIKFGEMERDCLIAHGAAANLHERLFTLSDSSQMHICRKCNNVANVIQRAVLGGRKIRGPYCRFCESVEDVVRVNVPYGAKLLCQELFSMGISLKFDTELC
ncbi:hypothetical protein DH2020_036488 [Rehmannia glutinosa]|uniref:DNA-directed RNA polymerase subunit beta n=2 Tax=Rehmannia glutinosa TaxID=99300 RepID=A0ABR0V648_REHGL